MKICKGWSRTAYVAERVTIKRADIKPVGFIKSAVREIKDYVFHKSLYDIPKPTKEKNKFLWNSFCWSLERSFKGTIGEGIASNLREAFYSGKLGDVVVPTRVSFFGVFNIMDTAQPIEEFSKSERNQIFDILAPYARHRMYNNESTGFFSHDFLGAKNYGIHNGKLKLLDYGHKEVCHLLMARIDLGQGPVLVRDKFRSLLDSIQREREQSSLG